MDKTGVSIIGMPCNTAHILYPEISRETKIEFPSMVDLVSQVVVKSKIRKTGLLATPTTIKTKLYADALNRRGIQCKTLNLIDQLKTEKIIRKIIGGSTKKRDIHNLEKLGKKLISNQKVEGLVLGCTELPIFFPKGRFRTKIFDCLEILADYLVVKSLNVTI